MRTSIYISLLVLTVTLTVTLGACRQENQAPRERGRIGAGRAVVPRPGRARRAPGDRARWHPTVLIQLDGLPAAWLDRWLTERRFLPGQPPAPLGAVASGGLGRLAAGARASGLVPVDPSVTASNLATMLTGATVARHGILSNRFYRRGKRVNGFAELMSAETLWQAAPRQGLRTVTWATLGTFCDEAPPSLLRTVCFAAGRWLSRPQPGVVVQLSARSPEGRLTLRAGRRARGTARIQLGVRRGAAGGVVLTVPAGAVLRGGGPTLKPAEARDVLWSGATLPDGSPAPRRLTRVVLLSFDSRHGQGRARFYISATAVNRMRPAALRRTLDRAGLIRPALADERSFMKGNIDEDLFVRTGLTELDAAVELARWLGRKRDFDLAILYLGAVDSLGHQLLAQRGRQELSDAEVARFHAALERGLRAVDRRLARILDGLDLTRTRVVLASDHGMVPVLHDVSLRAALVGLDPRIRVITDAGAGFVHLPPGVPATVVKRRLSRIQVGGRRVFAQGRVVLAEGFARLGLPAGAADLFVQAAPGFSLSYRRTKTLTGWPKSQATHGFRSDLPAMHGVFLAAGPGVRAGRLGRLHMTQVAGAVSDAVGMARPRQARPGPAKLWKVPLAKRQAKRRATGGR